MKLTLISTSLLLLRVASGWSFHFIEEKLSLQEHSFQLDYYENVPLSYHNKTAVGRICETPSLKTFKSDCLDKETQVKTWVIILHILILACSIDSG
jgi:hypothetical protein